MALSSYCSRRPRCTSLCSCVDGVIDILQQRIDRGGAPCRIRLGPPIRAEACTRLAFRLFTEVVHLGIDNRDPVLSMTASRAPQNPRRPCVVALECDRSGQRD